MRIDWLGERSLIITEIAESAVELASALLEAFPSLEDAVPCYDSIGLYFCDNVPSEAELRCVVGVSAQLHVPSLHRVPVCYAMGEDFDWCAHTLGMRSEELVELHHLPTYTCAAVGFVPGFPYLRGLDSRIAGLSRLSTPRVRVAAGSVAVTGVQAGIYPVETPGGWRIVGRTPLQIVDEAEEYFPIVAGDQIQFFPISREAFEGLQGQRLGRSGAQFKAP